MSFKNGAEFTEYGWAVCLWAAVTPFQYGFHITALNQIHAAMTCKEQAEPDLKHCIPMTNEVFSWVTAMFAVGGLFGSLAGNVLLDKLGRRTTNRLCASVIILGSTLNGFGANPSWLMAGRRAKKAFIIGVGCGLGLVVATVFISEVAPSTISGNIGILIQLSIVVGIMISQFVGLTLATPTTWRYLFVVPTAMCATQLLMSSFIVESPYYLLRKNRLKDHKAARTRLWGEETGTESVPLLAGQVPRYVEPSEESTVQEEIQGPQQEISTFKVFKMKELRTHLFLVSLGMASQQLSGMSAILYYSNEILYYLLPTWGPYVSVAGAISTVLMTFPTVYLLRKIRRKTLLVISCTGAFITTIFLGASLNLNSRVPSAATRSSVAIIAFVMSFALGLGPLPFLMISEIGPSHATSALSSIALSVGWVTNFMVAVAFLPVRDWLDYGVGYREGLVYIISVPPFAITAIFLLISI